MTARRPRPAARDRARRPQRAGRRRAGGLSRPRPSTASAPSRRRRGGGRHLRRQGPARRPSADRARRPTPTGRAASPPTGRRCAQRADAGLLARPADADRAAPSPALAAAAAGGQDTIGLRCPAHPVAHALLRGLRAARWRAPAWRRRAPTASAASARPRPRTCSSEFGDELLVLDGGACAVRHRIGHRRLHARRAGAAAPGRARRARASRRLPAQRLRDRDADAPRASGTLEAHYAPRRQAAPDEPRRCATRWRCSARRPR